MVTKYLLEGLLFLSISLLGIAYNKWWMKGKKNKDEILGSYNNIGRMIKAWGIIILFGLLSILSLINAYMNS